MPVYGYGHGDFIIRASVDGNPFHCPWDSGFLGWAVVSRETARKAWEVKRLTAKTVEDVVKNVVAEVEEYAQYVNGEVYGYEVGRFDYDGSFDVLDACYGYIGRDYVEQEAREALNAEAEHLATTLGAKAEG